VIEQDFYETVWLPTGEPILVAREDSDVVVDGVRYVRREGVWQIEDTEAPSRYQNPAMRSHPTGQDVR
jgi:hypothetical protein